MKKNNSYLSVIKMFVYTTLFLVTPLFAQKKLLPPPPPHHIIKAHVGEIIGECAKTGSASFASRIKKYPFNLSSQIEFISFEGRVKISDEGNFTFYNADPQLIGETDTVAHIGMKEARALTLMQIDTLTDVLYNYGHVSSVWSTSTNGCYEPRNAILFRDKDGKALAFIEICFECMNTRESSDKISLGELCDQKLNIIKTLFRKAGIKYGVD